MDSTHVTIVFNESIDRTTVSLKDFLFDEYARPRHIVYDVPIIHYSLYPHSFVIGVYWVYLNSEGVWHIGADF